MYINIYNFITHYLWIRGFKKKILLKILKKRKLDRPYLTVR